MRKRLAKAVAALGICFALIAASATPELETAGDGGIGAAGSGQLVSARELIGSPGAAGKSVEEAMAPFRKDPGSAPEHFAEEVLGLEGKGQLVATETWDVVGFTLDGAPFDAFGRLTAELKDKGWSFAPLGVEGAATGWKEEGSWQWMLISCTAVGDETAVVLRFA